MKPRDCVRLLVVGVCAGLLPACTLMPNPTPKPPARSLEERVSVAPPPMQVQRPVWSPYGAIAMTDRTSAAVARKPALEKTPLPERPRLLAKDQPSLTQPPTMPGDGAVVLTAFPPTEDEPPATPAKAEEALRPRYLPASFTAEPPVVAALRCFMDRRPDAALEQLARYDAENQDILLHLLPLTARMAEGPISQADPQELAAVIDQMQGVIMALRPRAALVMDKVCFCRQVRKFGVYESLGEKPSFRRGELVEMYCEVRNIACERTTGAQGEYRTHLQNSLEIREIRDPVRGFRIQRETKKADLCHTPQHDYYLHYSFAIRDDMKPGPYVLTVEVVDVPTGRKINRKLEFVVRAE